MSLKPQLSGRAVRVLVCTERKTFVTRELAETRVTFEGIEGDRHAGLTRSADVRTPWFPKGTPIRNTRQLSLVSSEELAEVAEALGIPKVLAAWLGANLELAGVPRLTHLPPGTRLFFPEDAVLAVEGENEPCRGPGRVIEAHHPDKEKLASRFVKAAWRRRGLVAWVERPGLIRAGDEVRVMVPRPVTYVLPGKPA
ncbi:MOSC domain-containing protein [Pyxidicoccus fallax]|uniref:MOSC domain-containing protein n=1 Tax=Pyxidicoccus fallax TaxID=394095 RepID=A0A848LWP9_9BACT|nr:MOSC domain-containing protein [Pyxidicoccus fallax]NMO22455.1 MOSC domain-containing protein [Pyxidicoccus fallax]NPC86411.1 MOSC domain-containing protein [Pyxidicoccus fallax]